MLSSAIDIGFEIFNYILMIGSTLSSMAEGF